MLGDTSCVFCPLEVLAPSGITCQAGGDVDELHAVAGRLCPPRETAAVESSSGKG